MEHEQNSNVCSFGVSHAIIMVFGHIYIFNEKRFDVQGGEVRPLAYREQSAFSPSKSINALDRSTACPESAE